MGQHFQKSNWITLTLMVVLLCAAGPVVANHGHLLGSDSTETDSVKAIPEPLKLKLKPTLGLGAGMFTFYGDIASNHAGYHPTVSRVGWDLRVTNPLTSYLDLSFYALFGRVGANERSLNRNLNFESRITTGGMTLAYNFHHFLKEDRIVEPYFSVGIESFEFLSKTDLYDANGNMYNYWSDGTIRNMPENDPNASQAIEIYRDYTYETDLRELDLDGFGKYQERSWAIPVGVGATLFLSDKVNFKVGTSMHFGFTDLVDNVTSESLGDRAGNEGNDKFLFTSFSLNYNLQLGKDEDDSILDDEPFQVDSTIIAQYNLDDEDQDGVIDFEDNCPGTPQGVIVNEYGCPDDTDKDGVPDYMDEEPNTEFGNTVDSLGVTLDDEYWAERYNKFMDSTGAYVEYNIVRSEISNGESDPSRIAGRGRTYTVKVGGEEKAISQTMVDYILSLEDVETEIDENGNVVYNVGSWDEIEPAMLAQIELQNQGIEGQIAGSEGGTPLTPEQIAQATENVTLPPIEDSNKTVFRVQIGAFKNDISPNVFGNVPNIVVVPGEDYTRYLSGSFTSMEDAASHKINLVTEGYDGAFIVAYRNGKRISLQDAGATIVEGNPEEIEEVNQPTEIDKSKVKFRVQVGAFANEVPTDMLDLYIKMGNVEAKRAGEVTKYVIGYYDSYEEAQAAKAEFAAAGAGDAFVIGDFNGNLISSDEAIKLLNQ